MSIFLIIDYALQVAILMASLFSLYQIFNHKNLLLQTINALLVFDLILEHLLTFLKISIPNSILIILKFTVLALIAAYANKTDGRKRTLLFMWIAVVLLSVGLHFLSVSILVESITSLLIPFILVLLLLFSLRNNYLEKGFLILFLTIYMRLLYLTTIGLW